MQFDVIVMLIFLATLPQTLNVIFSMEIALRHHRFCDFKYSNLEWATSSMWWCCVYLKLKLSIRIRKNLLKKMKDEL